MAKDKLDAAQAELEHRERQAMVDWAREHGREHRVTYAVETESGEPVGVSDFVVGACFVNEAVPDHSGDN